MRYGPVLGGARDRMLPSSEVRVRYFDPRTGEPCDEKPEPLGTDRIAERIAARDAWAERDGLHRAAVDEATAVAVERGYLYNFVPEPYEDPLTGERKMRKAYARVTPKGVRWMTSRYCRAVVA